MPGLFGKSKQSPTISDTLNETSSQLDNRVSELGAKINIIQERLNQLKIQMQALPENTFKGSIKQTMIDLLKRKKAFEAHRDAAMNQSLSVMQAGMLVDSLKSTATVYQTLKCSNKQLKQQVKKMDIAKVEKMYDEMKNYTEEFNLTMQPGSEYSVDEEELEEELSALNNTPTEGLLNNAAVLNECDAVLDKSAKPINDVSSSLRLY